MKQNHVISDYYLYSLEHDGWNVVQMDAVISANESFKSLLTLYFVNFNFQLSILLPYKEGNSA